MAWERLAHAEITGSAGILTSGTFTAKKNLKVILYVTGLSVVNNTAIVFNTDNSSTNYGIRGSVDGGSDYSHGSQTAIVISPTAQDTSYSTFNITNIDGQEKIVIHDSTNTGGSGSGNAPSRREGAGKWATTSGQITKITVTDNNGGTGSITCGVGSYITVLGAKEPATADVITVDCGTTATAGTTSSGGTLNITSGGSTVLSTIDVGTTSDTKWVLRYKANFGTWSANSYFHVCLSDNDNPITSSQDELGVLYRNDSSSNNFGVHTVAGANPNSVNSQDQQTWSTSTSTDYYFEIVRESSTSAKVNFYGTDSTYTTVSSTSSYTSVSANCDGLDRIKIMENSASNTSGAVTISDIEFYNGITAVTSGKKHLMIQAKGIASSADISFKLRFNNDSGSNYTFRSSANGGADGTDTSETYINAGTGFSGTANIFGTFYVINEAAKEKLVISECTAGQSGAGTAPERKELVGKWANTSNAITRVDVHNSGSGDFGEGSEVTVYGTD